MTKTQPEGNDLFHLAAKVCHEGKSGKEFKAETMEEGCLLTGLSTSSNSAFLLYSSDLPT